MNGIGLDISYSPAFSKYKWTSTSLPSQKERKAWNLKMNKEDFVRFSTYAKGVTVKRSIVM